MGMRTLAPVETMPLTYFVNGPVQGRIAFNTYVQRINDWRRDLWQPGLPFSAPTSLKEQEAVTRTSMEVMRLLFRLSSMSATIGGTIQSLAISPTGVGEVSLVTEAVPDRLAEGTGLASLESDADL
jgi:hypothetical protein